MTDESTAEARPPQGHPVTATLAGAAVLVLGGLIVPILMPAKPLTTLIIFGGVAALLLWGIGYVATIRHASLGWKIGSFVLLSLAGDGAGAIAHSQYQTRARADASSFAEIEFGPTNAPKLAGNISGNGPISGLYAAAVQADALERQDFGAALGKLGVANLTSPYLLQQDPRAIQDCGAIDGIAKLANDQGTRRAERQAALDKALAGASLPGTAKSGIAMMVDTPRDAQGRDAVLVNQLATLDATKELCALLARKSWFNDNAHFGFNSATDARHFATLGEQRRALAAEEGQIARTARERIEKGRERVRDALSVSVFAAQ